MSPSILLRHDYAIPLFEAMAPATPVIRLLDIEAIAFDDCFRYDIYVIFFYHISFTPLPPLLLIAFR